MSVTLPVSMSTSTRATCTALAYVTVGTGRYTVASKSASTGPGPAKVGRADCTTRANGTADCGTPRTYTCPSSISMSSGAASMSSPAARASLSRTRCDASLTALPPTTALRLANVPTPKGRAAVSALSTVTCAQDTPRASAASCANVVACPCPCEQAPVTTTTPPDASTATVAPS